MNGTLTGYYLGGNTILIEKTNGANSAQYTWGDGLIRCNGEYPLEDGRGNVRFTTNASKTITSSNSPNAFGVGSVTSGTASAFSWNAKSGYRQDGVAPTGLSSGYAFQKVGDRYYDPTLMCFLTRDTELDQLPYTYCGGDPVNCTDPSGHKTKKQPGQPDNGPTSGGTGAGGAAGGATGGVGGGAGSDGGGNAGSTTIQTGTGTITVSSDGSTVTVTYAEGPGQISFTFGPGKSTSVNASQSVSLGSGFSIVGSQGINPSTGSLGLVYKSGPYTYGISRDTSENTMLTFGYH